MGKEKYSSDEWEIVEDSADDVWEIVSEDEIMPQQPEDAMERYGELLEDAGTAVHQALTWTHSDELAGKVGYLAETLTGGDTYQAKRVENNIKQKWRGRIAEAKERSPLWYTGVELITPSIIDVATLGASKLPTLLGKLGRYASKVGPVIQGGIAGAGASDSDDYLSLENAKNVAIGAGAGLGGKILAGGTKWAGRKAFGNPWAIRSKRTGAVAGDFENVGRKAPRKVDAHLDKIGFYKGVDKYIQEVDPKTLKIKRTSQLAIGDSPADKMRGNADKLIREYGEIKDNIITGLSDYVKKPIDITHGEFIKHPEVLKITKELAIKSRGNATIKNAQKKVLSKLKDSFETIPGPARLDDLFRLKSEMQTLGESAMFEGGQASPGAKIFAELQKATNNVIGDLAGRTSKAAGTALREIGESMSRLITKRENLIKKGGQEMGGGLSMPFPSPRGASKEIGQQVLSSPVFGKLRESIGFKADKVPTLVDYATTTLSHLPRKAIVGAGISGENTDLIGQINSIPRMIAKTPIPRDSKAILENKEFVKAKIGLSAPVMIPWIEHVLDEQPEKLPEILPMLIELAPEMFESDIYNRIDGKIGSPVDREKALEDTRNDEMLSNTQKALISHNISLKGMV